MTQNNKGKIYYSMQAISLLPILLFGVLILFFGTFSFTKAMTKEVEDNLDTTAHLCISLIDLTYPGDYVLQETSVNGTKAYSLYKGNVNITSRYDIVDRIKEDTGLDITLFYQDTRILTTIQDWNNRRIIGTGAPEHVIAEVMNNNQVQFYDNAMINGTKYFACYHPITNKDGTVTGMLFVGKPVTTINQMIKTSLNPLIMVGLFSLCVASIISFSYAKNFLSALQKLESFFSNISTGNLNAKMDSTLLKRRDEFTEIAESAIAMQKSLRNMVELDSLTTLFNRRTGDQRLHSTYLSSKDTHTPFCIVMADIDHFKRINDTYGHHNGDIILQNVSNILKAHTAKKGYTIRWGGEEFLLVFENHDLQKTLTHLEALQNELRHFGHTIEEKEIFVTMTFGVACDAKLEIKELIELADAKLYEGKAKGRDCIMY